MFIERNVFSSNVFQKFSNTRRKPTCNKKKFCNSYVHEFNPESPVSHKIIQLQTGLILIKNGLTIPEQKKLTEIAFKFGQNSDKGFWKIDQQGKKVLNQAPAAPHRGRIFDALENFPKLISDLSLKHQMLASHIDQSLNSIKPTHLILLYYRTLSELPKNGYIPWHQDKDPNDGENNYPVVSFNIGDSCEFLVCDNKPKINESHSISNPQNLKHRILLESGDVLIFGGPSRYIHHGIYKIDDSGFGYRLNFTFRYAPTIIGNEDNFSSKNFKSVYAAKNE